MNIYDATERAYKNGYNAGVKEFAEKLKEKMQSSVTMAGENVLSVHPRGIDNLVKEMAGE